MARIPPIDENNLDIASLVDEIRGARGRLINIYRLMLHSLLEDGEYARVLLSRICGRCLPVFSASLAAARDAGDLCGDNVDPQNAFWFAAHVACQIAQEPCREAHVSR